MNTPLTLASKPHDRLCIECAPATVIEFKPVSSGQVSALHAKCNALQLLTRRPRDEWKNDVKRAAGIEFQIEVVSFKELTYEQASWCLDWLDDRHRQAA